MTNRQFTRNAQMIASEALDIFDKMDPPNAPIQTFYLDTQGKDIYHENVLPETSIEVNRDLARNIMELWAMESLLIKGKVFLYVCRDNSQVSLDTVWTEEELQQAGQKETDYFYIGWD